MPEFVAVELSDDHDLSSFHCGEPTLDSWLVEHALAFQQRDKARVMVWATADEPARVVAYYSTNSYTLERRDNERWIRNEMNSIPATLIGKLAVDGPLKGHGLGGLLLSEAVDQCVRGSRLVASRYIVVDALNDNAQGFYEHYGFKPKLRDQLRKLLLKMDDAAASLPAQR